MALPVNPASIQSPGGDYTSVAAYEADLDDATFAEDYYANVTGVTADVSEVVFAGVDSDIYTLFLQAASGQEADGTDNKGAVIPHSLSLDENGNRFNVFLTSLELYGGSIGGLIDINLGVRDSVVNITKCCFRDSNKHGIKIASTNSCCITIGVCIFRQINSSSLDSGIYLNDSSPNVRVVNCTFYDCYDGIYQNSGSFYLVKNCISICNEVNASYTDFGNNPSLMSYCISSDLTGGGPGSQTGKSATDNFTDAVNDDFTMKNNLADTFEGGLSISGEPWFPSTDMVGTPWRDTPAVGAYEYVPPAEHAWYHQIQQSL